MKTRLITAAIAAFFMFPFFGVAAYAAPADDISLPENMAEIETVIDEAPTEDIDWQGESPVTGGLEDFTELPAPPPGTGTVIDYSTDSNGTLFYTIMTPDEHVFYLVIEQNRNIDNVYFLNAVTVADLLPLAQLPPQTQGGTITAPPTPADETEQPGVTPQPSEQEQQQGGNNAGTLIFVVVIVALGGGVGWYFKIYRPKQQSAADGDEYDPSMDVAESDYADDWDGDANESDDNQAWGEDADSGDDTE